MWANLHLEPIITKTTTNRDGIHYPTPVGHFYLSDNSNFFLIEGQKPVSALPEKSYTWTTKKNSDTFISEHSHGHGEWSKMYIQQEN